MNQITSKSADETRELGASIARGLSKSASDTAIVIALNGELGAGKTTFVGGLLRALGADGPVKSPTYTLIEPYDFGSLTIYHLDLYRLADARDLEMLAPRDLLNKGSVLLIEWAERGGRSLPEPDLVLNFRYSASIEETLRIIEWQAVSTAGKGLAASLHG